MGVGFRQPVLMRIVLFSDTFSFLVWVLLSPTGAAYSTALNTMARIAVGKVVALHPMLILPSIRSGCFELSLSHVGLQCAAYTLVVCPISLQGISDVDLHFLIAQVERSGGVFFGAQLKWPCM